MAGRQPQEGMTKAVDMLAMDDLEASAHDRTMAFLLKYPIGKAKRSIRTNFIEGLQRTGEKVAVDGIATKEEALCLTLILKYTDPIVDANNGPVRVEIVEASGDRAWSSARNTTSPN